MFDLISLCCTAFHIFKKIYINSLDIQLISSVSLSIQEPNFMCLQVYIAWLIETVRLCYDNCLLATLNNIMNWS